MLEEVYPKFQRQAECHCFNLTFLAVTAVLKAEVDHEHQLESLSVGLAKASYGTSMFCKTCCSKSYIRRNVKFITGKVTGGARVTGIIANQWTDH